MIQASLSAARREVLRGELLHVVDLLRRRLAGQISEETINDMVTLSWLEWIGGSLQLTTIGSNICRQLQAR